MSIIDEVRSKQRGSTFLKNKTPLPQDPEMLYIGCVDARLDPVADIGIKQGRALIYRNIGALVQPPSEKPENGEVTARDSIGAVLELFLDIMDEKIPDGRKFIKKHIVVSGHTHCGGINCACGKTKFPSGGLLKRYLSAFTDAVADMLGIDHYPGPDDITDKQLRDLERESVKQSVENLKAYPIVQKAIGDGRVELHGWVIDTATKHIMELKENGEFVAMDEKAEHRGKHAKFMDKGSNKGFSSPDKPDRKRG